MLARDLLARTVNDPPARRLSCIRVRSSGDVASASRAPFRERQGSPSQRRPKLRAADGLDLKVPQGLELRSGLDRERFRESAAQQARKVQGQS
jgi:hypothetical protein